MWRRNEDGDRRLFLSRKEKKKVRRIERILSLEKKKKRVGDKTRRESGTEWAGVQKGAASVRHHEQRSFLGPQGASQEGGKSPRKKRTELGKTGLEGLASGQKVGGSNFLSRGRGLKT